MCSITNDISIRHIVLVDAINEHSDISVLFIIRAHLVSYSSTVPVHSVVEKETPSDPGTCESSVA